MPLPIVLLLFGFPLLELAGLIMAGREFGAMAVLFWVVLSAIIGIQIIRAAGWVTARKVQEATMKGEFPLGSMFQAASMIFSGFFLIVPGLATDAVGILLLLPPVRIGIGALIASRASIHGASMGQRPQPHGHGDSTIIDGDFTVVDDPEETPVEIEAPSGEKSPEKDS